MTVHVMESMHSSPWVLPAVMVHVPTGPVVTLQLHVFLPVSVSVTILLYMRNYIISLHCHGHRSLTARM